MALSKKPVTRNEDILLAEETKIRNYVTERN